MIKRLGYALKAFFDEPPKESKLIGEHVKYSHETAKANPNMIVSEFEKIKAMYKKEIKDLQKLVEYYSFEIYRHTSGASDIQFINGGSEYPFKSITPEFRSRHINYSMMEFDEPIVGKYLFIPKADLKISVEDVYAAFKRNQALHVQIDDIYQKYNETKLEELYFEEIYRGRTKSK